MGKLLDNGTCMYSKWTSSLEIFGVKVTCEPIIPSWLIIPASTLTTVAKCAFSSPFNYACTVCRINTIYIYRIALNFRGSLISRISRIFSHSRKYFNEIFWHAARFSRSDCKSVDGQHPGAIKVAESARNSLQGDTFEVAIALLTATNSSGRQCDRVR